MKLITAAIISLFMINHAFSQKDKKGNFSGLVFGDYFYNISRDTGISSIANKALDGKEDLNVFQFRRIYFTYDYNISETFISRFRLEFKQTFSDASTKGELIVKDAYLEWKNIFEGSELIVGIQPTPAFQVSEKIWGYRSLEKTIQDLRGIVSSRDLAISLLGRLNEESTVNYWIMFGNGSSNISETDKYKSIYAHLNFIPVKKIMITLYGDMKFQKNINNPLKPDEKLSNNVFSTATFVGFIEKDFSLGIEGFLQINQNDEFAIENQSLVIKNRSAVGISLFENYKTSSQIALIGRYDYFDPNTDFNGDTRNYFLFGLNFKPHPEIDIIPNIQIETYETILNREFESSVTARITFNYNFF